MQKGFAIAFDPPRAIDPKSLETRACESLDKIFETIFTDQVIKGVLTKWAGKGRRFRAPGIQPSGPPFSLGSRLSLGECGRGAQPDASFGSPGLPARVAGRLF